MRRKKFISQSNKNDIIEEACCPISREKINELKDPVVFRRRVYSKESLRKWYLEQLKSGKKNLTDIMSGELLPPIKHKASRCDNILNYAPKLTEIEYHKLLCSCLFIILIDYIYLEQQSNHFISKDSLSNLRFSINIIICLVAVPMYAHHYQRYREKYDHNPAQNENELNEWLEEQIREYNPDHSPKGNALNLSSI